MADERDDTEHTEDPTPRRLEEAIKRGDVVKSVEVSTWFTIGGGTLMLMVFAGPMAESLQAVFRGVLASFRRNSRRRAGARPPHQGAGDACPCRARHPHSGAGARRAARQRHPASHLVLGRSDHAAAVADFAGGGAAPAVFQAGARQFRQGSRQAHAVRRGDRRAVVAAAPADHRLGGGRSGHHPAVHPRAGDKNAGHGGGDSRHRRGGRLPVPVPAMVRAAENVGARDEGGVPPERGRSRHQRQNPAVAHRARAESA